MTPGTKRCGCGCYGHVYLVKSDVDSRVYVGQTRTRLTHRMSVHRSTARHRYPRSYTALHQAMVRYGMEHFEIEDIGAFHSQTALDRGEREAIRLFGALAPNGYNVDAGGMLAGSRRGSIVGAVVGAAHRGRKRSEQWRRHIAEAMQKRAARRLAAAGLQRLS